MNSEAMDEDPMDGDPESYESRGFGRKNSRHTNDDPIDGSARDGGPMGRTSVDMIKLFARYKAGDFNEEAARELADVFRELSDTVVSIKTGSANDLLDDVAVKEDFLNAREDFTDLKDDFYGLKDDYFDLKDDYFSLKDSYYNIKDEYTSLKAEYAKLKELYEHDLNEEKTRIRAKLKSLQRRVRVYFLLLLILVLLGTPPSMDLIYKFFGLH
ncbi:MAG: hypothetical protein HQK99_12675 [Nitrospirae bacterium]|nr:hypothetical protein [Nitrospirota bacterium]